VWGQSEAATSSAIGAKGATAAHVQQALGESGASGTGSGIKVGVLSDSFNDLGGAAADEASGALPSAANVQVLKDLSSGGTDESRMPGRFAESQPAAPRAIARPYAICQVPSTAPAAETMWAAESWPLSQIETAPWRPSRFRAIATGEMSSCHAILRVLVSRFIKTTTSRHGRFDAKRLLVFR